MQGRRRQDDFDPRDGAEAGDYWRVTWTGGANEWWFRDPRGEVGRVTRHSVTEHEDGTITVSPSIAPAPGEDGWHGYLEHGVWRGV